MLVKQKIKYIQSLGQKKFRDEHNSFVAEGPKTVMELLSRPGVKITELYATEQWLHDHPAAIKDLPVTEISSAELERISALKTPNGLLAVVEKFNSAEVVMKDRFILALDTIQDPGNLGTILRTADWFGVRDVICNTGCADIYNPKVVQASMGSIARVNVWYTDLHQWLSSSGARIYATSLDGDDITKRGKGIPGVLVIGNESRGIDPAILAIAHQRITIPRSGEAESLNAAVATGIVLSHLLT